MTLAVVTAGLPSAWEADLVATFARSDHGLTVVRRCVDVTELLAVAGAGLARAALVAADLRLLDRDVLTRLAVAGIGVVGVAADDTAADRLARLGVSASVRGDAAVDEVAAALLAAASTAPRLTAYDVADPVAALPTQPTSPALDRLDGPVDGGAHVIAVWGPTGAPGRSTVAVSLAAELAELGSPTLLVDADVYGGSVAQLLALLDESPGIAAACRLANNATLDAAGLAELALEVRPQLRVLTGLTRADRWHELRAGAVEVVLACARLLASYVVVDCGFCLERDEELSFDTAAPRRNGATLAVLSAADTVLAVGSGDPVGLQRLVRGVAELTDAVPTAAPVTVVNRVRASALGGGDARAEISAALERFGGLRDVRFVPSDVDALDHAVATGRTLAESAPASPARLAVRALAAELAGVPAPARRRRLALRRAQL